MRHAWPCSSQRRFRRCAKTRKIMGPANGLRAAKGNRERLERINMRTYGLSGLNAFVSLLSTGIDYLGGAT